MEYLVLGIAVVAALLVGVAIGIFIGTDRMRKAIEEQSVGHLRIDRSEPDEPPRPFLEITRAVSIDEISNKNIVILKVINESYISQN